MHKMDELLMLILSFKFLTSVSSQTVDLSFSGFDGNHIPASSIPSTTTTLILSNNPLKFLPRNVFVPMNLISLTDLQLNTCELTDSGLTNDSFNGLPSLTHVSGETFQV